MQQCIDQSASISLSQLHCPSFKTRISSLYVRHSISAVRVQLMQAEDGEECSVCTNLSVGRIVFPHRPPYFRPPGFSSYHTSPTDSFDLLNLSRVKWNEIELPLLCCKAT